MSHAAPPVAEVRTQHRSEALLNEARTVIPGGVNSPVRAFAAVEGSPPFIARGEGAWMTDADGHRYLDLVGSWGPLILGHAHPGVLKAISDAAASGTSFGAPTEGEVEFAREICDAHPCIEMVRLCSSGTEATMHAIRLARGFTGRDRIIKLDGHYHGAHDSVLVAAGSGVVTFAQPGVEIGSDVDAEDDGDRHLGDHRGGPPKFREERAVEHSSSRNQALERTGRVMQTARRVKAPWTGVRP